MSEKREKIEEIIEEEDEEEEIVGPPEHFTHEEKQLWLRDLPLTQGCFPSPIDLNLTSCIPIQLPSLVWVNFEHAPKKNKVFNTGHTIIYSAKWSGERPHISGGPLTGKYVFSNFHLHWGENPLEGSEHTIDGCKYSAEMHVVFFKSCYLTQEAALKEQDGCVTLVYLIQLQDPPNPGFEYITNCLRQMTDAGNSKRFESICALRLFREFNDDYFMYWGSVNTQNCIHFVLWLISRNPIGISPDQIESLRYLNDHQGNPINSNFREVQPTANRSVFHVNPSGALYATMLGLSHDIYLQYCLTQVFYFKDFNEINNVMQEYLKDGRTSSQPSVTYESTEELRSDEENANEME